MLQPWLTCYCYRVGCKKVVENLYNLGPFSRYRELRKVGCGTFGCYCYQAVSSK